MDKERTVGCGFGIILGVIIVCNFLGISQPVSYLWSACSHPVEVFLYEKTPEKQHCVPQSLGGSHDTTAIWARSNHSVSDRWRGKPFLTADYPTKTFITLGNEKSLLNLITASKMGRYGIPYSICFHNYNNSSSSLVSSQLDGPSMIVYGISWLLNSPGKLFNQIAYTIEVGTEPSLLYLIDLFVVVLIWFVDAIIAFFMTICGFLIGCLCHPIDSICSLIGCLWFVLGDALYAIWWCLLGLFRILPFV